MDKINNNENVFNNNSVDSANKKSRIEKISFYILLISILLAPIAFIPSTYSSLDMVKTIIIVFGVLISSLVYFFSAWKNKELYFPKHPIVFVSIGIVISLVISTFLSTSFQKSFIGQAFEIGSTSFLLALFLVSLLVVYFVKKERDRIMYIYGSLIISFVILFFFHIIRMFAGSDVLSFGIFKAGTASILGGWSDFGIFAGLIFILSYITINLLTVNKIFKYLLAALMILSGFMVIIVNNSLVWLVLAVTFFAIAVSQYSSKIKNTPENAGMATKIKSLPLPTVIFLIIALIFTFKGTMIANSIIQKYNLASSEIMFPWQLTIDVASETIKESPLFGAGPNRFGVQYLRFKPIEVNQTPFFDFEFSQGFALLPTFFVTQGLVGGILWLLLVIMFIKTGFNELKKQHDSISKFFLSSVFFSGLFLWMVTLIHVPSHALLFITFVFLGLFIAVIETRRYSLNQKKIIVPISILIMIALAVWLFIYIKKTLAVSYFQSGISSLSLPENKGIENGEKSFKRALLLDENDIFYQALSEVTIVKINLLVQQAQQTGKDKVDQATIDQVLKLVDEALQYTHKAIKLDPTNYYNYIAESRVSEIGMRLGMANAYESIKTAYGNALSINRFSPSLYLNLARLEASQNHPEDAQSLIGSALQLKQNYIDAIFLLSQIQASQGKIKDAITSAQVASQINPGNALIFFQLGLLYYNDKNFEKATEALLQAVKIDENYANAQYFLGLSLARIGKIADAVPYFESLAQTNPDNQEVQFILSNLKAGKSPFAQAQPPIDNTPETRKTLPIKEKTTTGTKK